MTQLIDRFPSAQLPREPDAIAPDGSEVRLLLGHTAAGVAHFRLAVGETSVAVRHRTIAEIWYIVAGSGTMWRQLDDAQHEQPLRAGTCVLIEAGTAFQFRSDGAVPLEVVGVTMPPWPGSGPGEVTLVADARWPATVSPGALP